VIAHTPLPWFNLGLTIVDGIDTLLIAGLVEEYHEVRGLDLNADVVLWTHARSTAEPASIAA